MKILLYGEYSGIHLSLKHGLESLGHEVDVVTSGDGFKSFKGSIDILPRSGSIIKRTIADVINSINIVSMDTRYDVVQFINPRPGIVTPHLGLDAALVNRVRRLARRSFLYVCGCDSLSFNAFAKKSSYLQGFCSGCFKDNGITRCPHLSNERFVQSDRDFALNVDGIISSTSGAYFDMYASHPRFVGIVGYPIILPLSTDRTYRAPRTVLHGINRRYTKGSDVLLPLLQRLSDDGDIVLTVADRLPFSQYIDLVQQNRFVVDQLYADSLGMNALFSMAYGSVVCTRFESKRFDPLPPTIELNEDPDCIAQMIRDASNMSDSYWESISRDSVNYVAENHHSEKIASQFCKLWMAS